MGYSVRGYLGYGYGFAQGHMPFGSPILSCQRQGGKAHMFRIQDLTKQTAHS
jgi:hypothetical protein